MNHLPTKTLKEDRRVPFDLKRAPSRLLFLAVHPRWGGTAGGFRVHVIADAHIYDRHVPVIEELIKNEPKPAPKFIIDKSVDDFYKFTRDSFKVEGYEYSEFNGKIPVAV